MHLTQKEEKLEKFIADKTLVNFHSLSWREWKHTFPCRSKSCIEKKVKRYLCVS